MGISVIALRGVNFVCLYQGREGNCLHRQFTARCRSVHSFLQDSPVFDMDYVSESVFEEILPSVLEKRFPGIESLTKHQRKALLAVINRHIANRTWKVNYISVAP